LQLFRSPGDCAIVHFRLQCWCLTSFVGLSGSPLLQKSREPPHQAGHKLALLRCCWPLIVRSTRCSVVPSSNMLLQVLLLCPAFRQPALAAIILVTALLLCAVNRFSRYFFPVRSSQCRTSVFSATRFTPVASRRGWQQFEVPLPIREVTTLGCLWSFYFLLEFF